LISEIKQSQPSSEIDDLKEALAVLRESEGRFRDLAENIQEVFWLTNENEEFIYLSPAYEKIWGRTCKSCYGDGIKFLEAIHPDDKARVTLRLQCRSSGFDVEYRILRPDGTVRWIHDRAFPVRDDNGVLMRVAGIAEDITSRLRLADQRVHAQKMEAVGRLAGGVAHDFNNMLTVIKGHSEFLSQALPPEGELREDIDQITKAAQRGSRLTRQLLAFSRQQVLETRVIEVNALLRDFEKMLVRAVGEDINLDLSFHEDRSFILADSSQLEQAVMILVVNARDAMPSGGDIQLSTRATVMTKDDVAQYPDAKPGRYVALEVMDTGTGIEPDLLARIFEPFFTTKDAGRGTGLGLATVYGITQQLGGFVDVASTVGKGSAFTLFLPVVDAGLTESNKTQADISVRGDEKILLVEDQDEVRAVARRILITSGYTVIEARNGADALTLLQDLDFNVDLVLTDAVMPQMGGAALVRALRLMKPELPVVIVSGYTDRELVTYGTRELNVPFLPKPFRAEDLLRTVRKALNNVRS
jgi:two-component system, cell cycle sensor histidine kinase and response regulator CckA